MNSMSKFAYFAGGCFWCTEAIYLNIRGVISVKPGYAGGHLPNPTYEQVCSGNSGHAELVKIEYEPKQVDYLSLVDVFFNTHNPTTLNREGSDFGTQYRSAIFSEISDRAEIIDFIKTIEKSSLFKDNIVTEVNEVVDFYEAEEYHHNYFNNNPENSYCKIVISPKIKKFQNNFSVLISK